MTLTAPAYRRIALAACGVALCLAPPAEAASVVVGTDRDGVDLPRLTSDGALWLSTPPLPGGGEVSTRLLRGRVGRPVEPVATVGGRENRDGVYGSGTVVSRMTVFGERLAFSTVSYSVAKSKFEGDGTTAASANTLDLATKARTRVLECASGGAESAVAFPWLATVGCHGPTPFPSSTIAGGAVDVRDLSRPATPPIRVAEQGRDVRIAGTKVGWRAADAFVVHDLATRAEILRVPTSALGGAARTWDLQADGKLAVAVAPQTGTLDSGADATKVVWAAPGSPPPRTVVVGGKIRGPLRLVGDRFAFERLNYRLDLVVRPLLGVERVVARYAPAHVPAIQSGGFGFDSTAVSRGGLDFDGTRLAWARARCDTTQIVVRPADEPGVDENGFALCALQLGAYADVDRRARLSTTAMCPALSPRVKGDSCRVLAALRLDGRPIASARRRIRAGTTATLRFGAQPRLLRKRPKRLVIRAVSMMRGGTAITRATIAPSYPPRKRR